MAERLAIRYKSYAAPGNVEKSYATKVGGVSATLTHYLEKAKTAIKEESGFLEFELSVGTIGPGGISVGPSNESQKYVVNLNDISSVTEY